MQHDIAFSIVFDGRTISVNYRPNYFSGYDHFEFVSPYEPKRPIPLSPTGYRSHFAPNHEVEAAPSVEVYTHELMDILAANLRAADVNQLNLF